MKHFCTYFDKNYAARGLALFESLEKHACDFELYVLCLDETVEEWLRQLQNKRLIPIPLKDLEEADQELKNCKSNRSIVEYFFTLSPCLPLYLLKRFQLPIITYLDSDLYFFADPEPLYTELGERSILIIPHRFEASKSQLQEYGIYNVGCQLFRNDTAGLACLEQWRQQCIEWCYDRLEATRYADQKYLDRWPSDFPDAVVVSQHLGCNLAPWNVGGLEIRLDPHPTVNGQALIFYHFQRLRMLSNRIAAHGLEAYGVRPKRALRNGIYAPYIAMLRKKRLQLAQKQESTLRLQQKQGWKAVIKSLYHRRAFISLSEHFCW